MGTLIVQRPVTIIMAFCALCLFGIISLCNLTMDLLPPVQYPEISVITLYPGAAPSEIEQLITRPVEEAVNSVAGVKRIHSESIEGASLVVATLQWGSNIDFALLKVREKVDLVKGILPQDVYKPIVTRFDPNSLPVMNIAITSQDMDLRQLRHETEKNIVPLFERIEGVGNAKVTGGKVRQIEVLINRDALQAYSIGIHEIIDSIQSSHFNYPAGTLVTGNKELLIRTSGEFKNISDIENVSVKKTQDGRLIFLKHVARVIDGFKEITSQSFINGHPCVTLSIIKESGKNTVEVCRKTRHLVENLQKKYDRRLTFDIINDQSQYIRSAISSVVSSAIAGSFIAFFVLLLFTQRFFSAFIITIAIPVSIIITFFFMNLFSININMMSLGGLTICVGMLVDCGIVVIESISNVKNTSLQQAIYTIAPSLIASTLTSVVIFLPLLLIKGLGGALFAHLAITVTIALFASLFVALLLIPALYTILSQKVHHAKKQQHFVAIVHISSFFHKINSLLHTIEHRYVSLLDMVLSRTKCIYMVTIAIIVLGVCTICIMTRSLMPDTKQSEFTIRLEAPPGTTLQQTINMLQYIDSILKHYPDIDKRLITAGYNPEDYTEYFGREKNTNIGQIYVLLHNGEDARDCITYLEKNVKLADNVHIEYNVTNIDFLQVSRTGSGAITINCTGNSLHDINAAAAAFIQECTGQPWITQCYSEIKQGKPELTIQADTDRLASYGLTLQDVASFIHTAVYGTHSGKYNESDHAVDIVTRFDSNFRDSIDDIGMIPIRANGGATCTLLHTIASISNSQGYSSIIRNNQQRCIPIHIVTNGISQENAIEKLQRLWEKHKQQNVSFVLSQEMIETKESLQSLYAILILSIVLIYMIIASQFESLLYPLLIMSSVPVALCGSFIFLFFTGKSINIMSLMGAVVLIGTIVNNAILLLDTIIHNYRHNSNVFELITKSCRQRLRPIIMTSLTTICGLIPLALGLQEGSDVQSPLAISIIGGMIAGTGFIMLCLPHFIHLAIRENS
ncbi:MAG: efflux RND transporter permease subunit [Spirochaetota bacterium]